MAEARMFAKHKVRESATLAGRMLLTLPEARMLAKHKLQESATLASRGAFAIGARKLTAEELFLAILEAR